MGTPFTCVGDKTTGGGVVVEGSQADTVEGKPISRIGDKATCTRKNHPNTVTIVGPGDPTTLVDGKPVSLHGDKLSCGCSVIAAQFSANSDPKGGDNAPIAAALTQSPLITSTNANTVIEKDYSAQFVVRSEKGKPLPNYPYVIESDQGHYLEGITDGDGNTARIYTNSPVNFTVRQKSQSENVDVNLPPASERFDEEAV